MTSARRTRPWPSFALGVLCIGAIVAAILVVGPASGSPTSAGRIIAAAQGVVQSTVSGSGNIQAANQLDLGFQTSGVVTQIYVTVGEHVTAGKLLAELDPENAEVALEQARASLQAGEANLVQEEETNGESSPAGESGAAAKTSGAAIARTAADPRTTAGDDRSATTKATMSPALRAANLASARAAIRSDGLAVKSAEETLADTKLYAPETGTIVSLSGEVGETVSGGGTTKASSSGSGSGGSGSGAGASALGSSAAGGGGAGSGSSADSGSADSSSAALAVLSDLSSMQLVVPLSESEVGNVKAGQPATVTIEALEGRELAAHVVSVATLPTSSSAVVSYDVTFQLDQLTSGLKPGMSATAEVVVKQAEGVNVPTTAITAGTVTVVRNGKQVRQRVRTGLAGNSSTIILSGLRSGEQVLLPVARTSSGVGLGGRLGGALGSRLGAGGFGGGAGLAGAPVGGFGGGGFRGG